MPVRFHGLRLLADDLTGALDSAVAFVRAFGPLEVGLEPGNTASLVLDSATRELPATEAVAKVKALAPVLAASEGRLSFFKVDSLLRGHAGDELATILAANTYTRVILAPALPAQGRRTENGRQVALGQPTGEDLAASLSGHGHGAALRPPGPPAEQGITLFDAATDADLDRLVADALPLPGSTLWVGTSGLAGALGRALGGPSVKPSPRPSLPLLGFVGTDHPVMQAQLRQVRTLPIAPRPVTAETLRALQFALEQGSIVVTCDLPRGIGRAEAHRQIAHAFAECVAQMPAPGTLFVSGGETLRALLMPLGARALRVEAEHLPGMPLSHLVGGRWNGLPILTKSGAFGTPDLLETLIGGLAPAGKAVAS